MKQVFTIVFYAMFVGFTFAQSEEELYYAWMDSMKNEKYIMSTVLHLDEVVISDSLHRAYLADPKNQSALKNTDQMLHALPGIHMVRRGNFAAEPMLRGLTSERYITSIDGMRVFSACTDKMDPVSSYIEPINLRSLETTFGSKGSMTGSSTGGSVNFGLKKPVFNREEPFTSSFNLGYSSVAKGFDQAFDINYALPKVAVRLSGAHRKSENYQDGNNREVRYSQYEKYNYATSISYRITDSQMLNFDFLGDDAIDVGYPALPMDVSSAKARIIGLTWIGPSLFFLKEPEFKVYYNSIKHVMDDTKRDSVTMHMDMPGETRTTGAYVKGTLHDQGTQRIEVKADFFQNYAYAEMTMYPNDATQLPMFMLTWPSVGRSVGGFEVGHEMKLTDELTLASSLRIEQGITKISSDFGERQLSVFGKSGNRRREFLTSTSSNLSWKRKKSTSMISVAYGERLPSVSEQFGFYLFNRQDGYDYIGDPDIQKEKNLHFEISNEWSSKMSRLKITGFTYLFSDYIMGIYDSSLSVMTIGALGVKWYRNVGEARMLGGEFEFQKSISENLTIQTNAKYVYGVDFEGDPLPQQPPLKTALSVTQNIAGWYIQPEVEFSAAQRRISEKFNENSTSSFMLVNMRISKKFKKRQVDYIVSGGIENIANVAYREHFDIGQIFRPGRNIYLNARFVF